MIKIMLKYNPQNEMAVNPVSELATPHAFTVTPIVTPAEMLILTEPMEQYQMAGTKGYVLVLPDEVASRLSGEKIRLVMKLEDSGYPELKNELKQFLNSGKWQPDIQLGQDLPERVTMREACLWPDTPSRSITA